MMVNELPVFHDGGSHTTANTHLIAKALLAQDQKKTVGILKYLAANGPDRMLQFDSLDELQSEFEAANSAITPDIYLVLTEQMAGWMGSISSMANWDLKTGTPINIGLDSTNPQLNYHRLKCRHHQLPSRIKCQQMNFSIEDGKTSFGRTLNGYSWSVNGITRYSKDYEEASNIALQTVVQDGVLKSQLLSKYLYRSAFNQLFYLNNISDPTISIFFDDYPKMRIFKIEGGG